MHLTGRASRLEILKVLRCGLRQVLPCLRHDSLLFSPVYIKLTDSQDLIRIQGANQDVISRACQDSCAEAIEVSVTHRKVAGGFQVITESVTDTLFVDRYIMICEQLCEYRSLRGFWLLVIASTGNH